MNKWYKSTMLLSRERRIFRNIYCVVGVLLFDEAHVGGFVLLVNVMFFCGGEIKKIQFWRMPHVTKELCELMVRRANVLKKCFLENVGSLCHLYAKGNTTCNL